MGWDPQFDFTTGVKGVWAEWKDADMTSAVAIAGGAGLAGGGKK
jgi:hypothetical protein